MYTYQCWTEQKIPKHIHKENCHLVVSILAPVKNAHKLARKTPLYTKTSRRCANIPCLNKNSQNCFHCSFVKIPPTVIMFGTRMAKTIKLYKVDSFSTSPNLCQCTTA